MTHEPRTVPVGAGTFCWHELRASDLDAACAFHASLFGWGVMDLEMPGPTYRLFLRGDQPVGGATAAASPGAPAAWRSYVAVDDVARSIDRAVALGGTALVPPTTTPGGTYAIAIDPGGAEVGLFRGGDGVNPVGVGAVMHNELLAPDLPASRRFYEGLFDWTSSEHDMGSLYVVFHGQADGGGAAPMRAGAMAPPPDAQLERNLWLPYVQVESCDATAARVAELGGRIAMPPTDIQTVGRIGVFTDPQGATLAVWTPGR